MSSSETDSDPEPAASVIDAVTSLTAFAHLSSTRPSDPNGQSTVSWAVDTLATLDFRLVRKDTALHGLIQNCASTILALFDTVLHPESTTGVSCCFIPDIASILRPSFLHLLFQYRRLFRVIAARDVNLTSATLGTVCWVDIVLAKLGDVIALIATGLDGNHPDCLLPESLMAQREEDNLCAAIQLPDNWDMLPSTLLSGRASAAAKRLCIRLLLGRYILYPALSGQAGMDDTIHQLLSTFTELVQRGAARVDELRSVSGPSPQYFLLQERLTGAMSISLFAAADIAQDSSINTGREAAFRPQTMAAAMRLLRFVLNDGEYTTGTNILNPPDHLDAPTSIIIRWGVVPQWTWNVWPEHCCLHADTIMYTTTTYIRHYYAGSGASWEASDLVPTNNGWSDQATVISVIIDLVFRFISMLSASAHAKQLSTSMMSILHRSCRLISHWMNHNACGIRRSKECCEALIVLFGYLSRNERHFALGELVIECLALMKKQCVREAWKAAADDKKLYFLEALGQSIIQIKVALFRDDFPESVEACAGQLMQFLVIIIANGVQPLDLNPLVNFIEAVAERVLEMTLNHREFLCETLFLCLAAANLSKLHLPFSKTSAATDDEVIWRLGTCGGDANLFLASAFSLYITSALAGVEPLTYVESLEHLLDAILLICSRHCPPEKEPLALLVLPTICDAVAHLLQHGDDTSDVYTCANARLSALCGIFRSICSGEDGGRTCDRYMGLLRGRLRSSKGASLAQWLTSEQMDGEQDKDERGYELVFCRLDRFSRLLYIRVV